MALSINKESILEKHCPSMSLLYLDDNGRAFRERILSAMEDHGDKLLHAERNKMQAKMTEMETGYLKQIQHMIDAFKMIINMPVPATEKEYMSWFIYVKNMAGGVISEWEAEVYVQQFRDGKGKECPCPHCGKELSRDRNLCCRECGKEVENG